MKKLERECWIAAINRVGWWLAPWKSEEPEPDPRCPACRKYAHRGCELVCPVVKQCSEYDSWHNRYPPEIVIQLIAQKLGWGL